MYLTIEYINNIPNKQEHYYLFSEICSCRHFFFTAVVDFPINVFNVKFFKVCLILFMVDFTLISQGLHKVPLPLPQFCSLVIELGTETICFSFLITYLSCFSFFDPHFTRHLHSLQEEKLILEKESQVQLKQAVSESSHRPPVSVEMWSTHATADFFKRSLASISD